LYTRLKSQVGTWPEPAFPPGTDLELEASRSRRRMVPVTVIYSVYLLALVSLAVRSSHLALALAFCVVGLAIWTLAEYLVHRFVLHVAFPARRDWVSRALHELFDAAHVDHHAQPWDGYHINGHLDTLFAAAFFMPLSFLAPPYTASVAVAALFVGYAAEEWVHHALHFSNFRWRYFQYLRRRHLYHHSRHGVGTAYGVTSDLWDKVFGTRIPAPQRDRLLPPPAGRPSTPPAPLHA
jgi:sterol desaturase/sphingolipid hydroxylase (fatty acid hydroxylase superfamily)